MPPKYPFVLLPLFLITSYYFYKINIQVISAIYILLYLFFLLSYIFARRWIIPLIFNFLPGLIPGLMTNQLAILANQDPSVDFGMFIILAIQGIGAGVSLRYGLAGYGNAKGFRKGFKVFLVIVGVFLFIPFILVSVGTVIGYGLSPTDWVNAIYFISPLYFTTSIITQLKHSEYKRSWSSSSRSKTSVQKYTTLPVHFWIIGLPQGTPVTIVVNGIKYTTTSDYLKVQQKGVNEYHWSALEVTVNNQTYVPLRRSGVLRPGQGIAINYYLATQTQAPQPSRRNQYVTFIVRGLPPSEKATIIVEGIAYTTDSRLVVSTEGRWVAESVKVGNEVYNPYPHRGYARYGDVITIEYRKVGVTATAKSRKLSPKKLSNWDPNVWVGRTLYVYKIIDVLGEGGNGYVLKGEYNGKEVAVKVLKLDYGNASQYFKDLFKESSNLVVISSNPKVVRIYGVYVNEQVIEDILKGNLELYETHPPMIAMEFMKGGTLYNLLIDHSFFYSSKWEKTVYRAIRDVAEALYFIHSQGYVHMDVKPQNIFLTERPSQPYELDNVQFKLGDLGSAVRVNSSIVQLTPMYSPPEVYESVAKPTFDVFALGMTMYVLLTRKEDRPDLNEMEEAFDCYVKGDMNCVKLKVETAKAKLAKWTPNVPDAVRPLLTRMLSPDPSVRPTAKEVAEYLDRLIP
jgi:predicted Ser/Thr protein kinase